jgi:ankyrin repeat protein
MRTAISIFVDFVRVVVDGDINEVSRHLVGKPALATMASDVGATRQGASTFFVVDIAHYLYAGDTALHMAAAAWRRGVAALLMAHGADCRAKNRRGAQPLHYAADANRWDPTAQAEMIEYLLSVGADPNALDGAGVAPLHRAVRTRSLAAVRALLDGGANSRLPNKAGSTPLHLAVQTTGRGGSGSLQAREQQAGIIRLLLERGATVADQDKQGKAVHQAATSTWSRALLREASAG